MDARFFVLGSTCLESFFKAHLYFHASYTFNHETRSTQKHPDKCSSAFISTAVGSVSDITLWLGNASKITSANTTTSETTNSTNNIVCLSNQRFERTTPDLKIVNMTLLSFGCWPNADG